MNRQIIALILCGGLGVLTSACATKGFVREQVGSTEFRLGQKVETQETRLQETTNRVDAHGNAIDAAGRRIEATGKQVQAQDQRIQGLDSRVGEAAGLAAEARKEVATVAAAQRNAEEEFTRRFANRNNYAVVDTKTLYFDFNKADLRDEGMTELEDIAKALKANPNAVLELQGFADPRGSDRYNYQLTRERVDAVVRYLVQRHGIDVRRLHAVGMGKVVVPAGQKTGKEAFAKSRRVELRLVAPQS